MARQRERAEPEDRVPGYRDLSEVGSGAFATVYQATEVDTGRPVALKILKADAVHPHLTETFQKEMQTLAKVSDHPNIVTFYRPLATPDGRPVLVLELCRESLAERLRRGGPLGARDVTRVGIKIAGALETAHRAGFLHRDLKPQNVLVTQFGEPALGDFGVAALQASAQATAGIFGFTTLHAAPEILEGHQLSPATDVYGLASTMYQALTGLAPFATFDNEAPASVILRIIRDPPRPIRSEHIPLALADLLDAALAKQPSGRPPTAAALADALTAIERAKGWPATSYVAWGQAGPPAPTESPPGSAPPPPPPAARQPPRPGPVLYPSAPSVQVAEVSPRRPMAPVDIGPAATGGPPPRPPEVVVSPPARVASEEGAGGAHSEASDESAGPAQDEAPGRPPPPSPPPPLAVRSGRGIARPDDVSRNVVAPGQSGRGQGSRPIPPARSSEAPLAPLTPESGAFRPSDRPQFLDPPAAGELAASPLSARESVYEQTLLPTARSLPSQRAGSGAAPAGDRRGFQPMLLAAILGLAVAVVILGILLVAGVL